MQSATYTILAGRPTQGAVAENAKAFKALDDRKVTFFGGPTMAGLVYIGSVVWSILLIVLDAIFLAYMSNEDAVHANATTVSIENGTNGWAAVIAGIMLGMDILVLVTQAVDLYFFHFHVWPLTALTWFGQLNGTGLASALLGMVLYYPFADTAQRDMNLTIAMLSLAAHALFISSQFSVTLEYLVRAVEKKD